MNITIVNPIKMQWEPNYIKTFLAEGWNVDPTKPPDVVLRMWCDQDTVDYVNSLDKSHHPKVIVFVRRYEWFTPWIDKIDWSKVDAVVMVNHYLADHFVGRTGVEPYVILNAVDPDVWTYKERGHGNKIAVVGYINQKKNLPLALQIVAKLNETSQYELHLAGGIQDGATVVYLNELANKLQIKFMGHGHVKDMDAWLEDKNYLLSCAISEGCPNNVIEAMAKGIKPIIHNWPGAEQQFPGNVFDTVDQAVEMILPESQYDSSEYRRKIVSHHGRVQYQDVVTLIKEITGQVPHAYHKLDWSPQVVEDVDYNLVSYPKSGRTWLRLFLQGLFGVTDGAVMVTADLFYPKTKGHPRIFSTHTHLNWNGGKTVFMLRDPRDIVVSSYFHNQRRSKTVPMDMKLSEFIRSDGGGIKFIVDWLNKWHERLYSNGTPEPLILRYEDLIKDDSAGFTKLVQYLGWDVNLNGAFSKAVEMCRFDNLRKDIDKGKFNNHPEKYRYLPWNPEDPESHKFRKGKVGGYVDYMSDEDIEYCNNATKSLQEDW